MARARNIKPGFFTNDVLAECEPLARLLFAGLWTIADREGRLEDRPKKIKAEILPYDDCEIDQLLNQLRNYGFIQRYQVGGKSFIQIDKFAKHQNPHVKEAESTIPAPGEHQIEIVQGITQTGSDPADSLLLIPDSIDKANKGLPACPFDEIVAGYHEALPSLPRVRALTDARKNALRQRWRENAKHYATQAEGVAWWRRFFGYVGESAFLTGRGGGERPFLADLEWLTKAGNFVKVIEGKYHA